MSNQHTQSYNSSIIYTPIPLKLSFSASRSSWQSSNSNILEESTSQQESSLTNSRSPRKILLTKFEQENQERPENPMTRDEKFKELQTLFLHFDPESFITEVELFD
ncbi:unnamed protein product [Paramecium primaurelia]|uniref:Uncharacterized protein n=1 Tax=Paramecium primaurelia TaxID=5886 RepID=A0A8S1NFU2_PARPR|nr:unnamed protein product [Paramecium primaurelia]